MKILIFFSFVFIGLASIIIYKGYLQSIDSITNNAIVNIEHSPCASPNLNDNTDKKIEKDVLNSIENNDIKEQLSLENIVANYFDVKKSSNIIISHQTEIHAQGEFGQKWWLAFNDKEDGWTIIATGCSYINCHEINGYDFPSEMVPVCWDTNSNQLINQ